MIIKIEIMVGILKGSRL